MPRDRKLLVLDLDETLVFATESALDRVAEIRVGEYHVYKRPHVDRFIDYALAHFVVGVWTSSGREYAACLCQALFPVEQLSFIWARDRCTPKRDFESGGWYTVKKLEKLKRLGFRLEETLVVDDTPQKHCMNYGNLIRVSEYNGSLEDQELPLLMRYLEELKDVPNVRAVEKRGWKAKYLLSKGSFAVDIQSPVPR